MPVSIGAPFEVVEDRPTSPADCRSPTVVLNTEARAAEKLRAFRHSRERWIVAVNMVSEGVDVPRLRVGVYATAAKTPLIFRQIVGRFVRTLAGRATDCSYLFLPADRLLRTLAADVEEKPRHVLHPPAEQELGAGRVTDASIEQLERSIELLLALLDRLSRRRAS